MDSETGVSPVTPSAELVPSATLPVAIPDGALARARVLRKNQGKAEKTESDDWATRHIVSMKEES